MTLNRQKLHAITRASNQASVALRADLLYHRMGQSMTNEHDHSMEKPDFMDVAGQVCIHPRQAIRRVIGYDARWGAWEILLALSGVSGLLALPMGLEWMTFEAVANFILLVAGIYAMAWLLLITGKPMGGKAGFRELCASMIWPMIPAIIGTALAVPLIGRDPAGDLVQGVFYLYSFHLMVETVAEVQGFAYWRSFFNQLLALLLSVLPFLLLGLLYWNPIATAIHGLIGF